jgi:predicted aconitase with swiveling domain
VFQDEIEDSFGFWGSVGATNFVFDPEVLYDQRSGRFFAMANERSSSGGSYFLLAVSDDSNPEGAWH